MTNHHQKIELNELILATGIYEAFENLEQRLRIYQLSDLASTNRYLVQQEVGEITKKIETLKNDLHYLILQSTQLKAP